MTKSDFKSLSTFNLVDQPSCCSGARPSEGNSLETTEITAPCLESALSPDASAREGMVYIPASTFLMGTRASDGFADDGEGPVHEVSLKPYYIDATTVTNAEFTAFIQATRYKTEAERFGWSFVFNLFITPPNRRYIKQAVPGTLWWYGVDGSDWSHPEGPHSGIEDRMDHPVVHISWNDAIAYSKWAGKRLPTEAEWEHAARGGLEQKRYPWGDDLTPGGEHYCNIWQGTFPENNTKRDGYIGTAPALSFPPNGYGLYNTSGNVWEWCQDWFAKDYYKDGPTDQPLGPPKGDRRSMRGGSYLCHKSYCNRYRVAARNSNTPDSSAGNIGFRCAADV